MLALYHVKPGYLLGGAPVTKDAERYLSTSPRFLALLLRLRILNGKVAGKNAKPIWAQLAPMPLPPFHNDPLRRSCLQNKWPTRCTYHGVFKRV